MTDRRRGSRVGAASPSTAPTRPTRPRKVARAPYHSRCIRCGVEFTTEAAEERHLIAEHHCRFELVWS